MGYRNSSAHVHDAGCLSVDPNGVARAAAESSALKLDTLTLAAPELAEPTGAAARGGAVWFLLMSIRFYQAVFARVMPVGCKFYPSCSRYAAEAIERHGAIRGARLALARLWRCRPFTQGGFDPVPDDLSHNEVQL